MKSGLKDITGVEAMDITSSAPFYFFQLVSNIFNKALETLCEWRHRVQFLTNKVKLKANINDTQAFPS